MAKRRKKRTSKKKDTDSTPYIILGIITLGAVFLLPKLLGAKEAPAEEPSIIPEIPPDLPPPYYVAPVIGTELEVYTEVSPSVNVRQTPMITPTNKVGTVARGSLWTVIETSRAKSSKDWYWVKVGRKYGSAMAVKGWVYGKYLRLSIYG